MTYAVRTRVLAPLVPAAAWSLTGAAGWTLFHALDGPARSGTAQELVWTACLIVTLSAAALVAATVARRYLVDDAARRAAAVGLGWGVANAAGWFLAVEVGGPATGLVTGVAVGAAAVGVRLPAAVVVGLGGVLAMVGARLLVAGLPPALGLVVSGAGGLAVVAVLRWSVTPTLPIRPVIVATVGFGVAWVGAWMVADAVLSPVSASASVALEIVVAVVLGAAVLGWELRARTAEPVRAVAMRWSIATVLAVAASAVIAAVIVVAQPGTTPIDHLDVGTTVTLPVAVWCAVRPTLDRLVAARTDAPGT